MAGGRRRLGGGLVFYERPDGPPRRSLTLPTNPLGGAIEFWVGGEFGRPSIDFGDAWINVATGPRVRRPVARFPLMVRVRKNANQLRANERRRFLAALAQVNNQGAGVFQFFADMHVSSATAEAHGRSGFLPWHRAYLMDLERELQAVDPSVTLPYWRFDEPAPRVFHRNFMGVADNFGTVQFEATNPLTFWVTNGLPGINRRPEFNTNTQAARSTQPPPDWVAIGEAATLALGGGVYSGFRTMEGNPHGTAHVSFGGLISSIGSAPRDPLFFMLHANVDRLWAKWQWVNDRFDTTDPNAYETANRIGHDLPDTMWPWNGVTTPPRPSTAPGGGLMTSAVTSAPGASPTVGQMLDYQGRLDPAGRLGFDYDDIPYDV